MPSGAGSGPRPPAPTCVSACWPAGRDSRQEAERHLKTADGMLRAMGMAPWVDAAEAAGRDLIHGRAGTA